MRMERVEKLVATELEALYLLDPALADRICDVPQHEARTFDLPKSIWGVMLASYAIFFLALIGVLGGEASALFMLVISIGYTAMYFGTAYVMNRVNAANRKPRRSDVIETLTGPLSYGAAFAQILTVPIMIGGFGVCVSVIIAVAP